MFLSKLADFLLKRDLCLQALLHTTPATNSVTDRDEMTFWIHFLLRVLSHWIGEEEYEIEEPERLTIGKMIESFLRSGADPRLSFLTSENKIEDEVENENDYKGYPRPEVEYAWKRLRGPRDWDDKIDLGFEILRGLYQMIARNGGRASFRESIPFFEFENQDTILRLIDRNVQELEQKSQGHPEPIQGTIVSGDEGDSQRLQDQVIPAPEKESQGLGHTNSTRASIVSHDVGDSQAGPSVQVFSGPEKDRQGKDHDKLTQGIIVSSDLSDSQLEHAAPALSEPVKEKRDGLSMALPSRSKTFGRWFEGAGSRHIPIYVLGNYTLVVDSRWLELISAILVAIVAAFMARLL